MLVVVAQFVVRTAGALQGTWRNDDWGFLHTVAVFGVSLDHLFYLYNGHLHPGAWLIFDALAEVAPGSYPAAAVLAGILQAIGTGLVYLVVRRLFVRRPAVLLLLVWFAFTPLTLDTSTWAIVAFNVLPLQIAYAGGVLLLLRYLERPSSRRLVAVVAMQVFGLLFIEKAVLLPVLLFGVAAWFPVVSATPLGARRVLREHRRLWLSLAPVVAAYAALYLWLGASGRSSTGGASLDFGLRSFLAMGWKVVRAFATSLFGGPWAWGPPPIVPRAAPPAFAVAIALGLLVALVVWTSRRRSVARIAWLCLAGYVMLDIVLIASGRLAESGSGVGSQLRLFADLAIPTVLVVGFALFPRRVPSQEDDADAVVDRLRSPWRPVLLVGLAVAFLVSSAVSYVGDYEEWRTPGSERYVSNAREGFHLVADVGLLPQVVSADVLAPIFYPRNTTDVVLAAYPGSPPFRAAVDDLYALDGDGTIVPARVAGRDALPGGAPDCGWSVTPSSTRVPLEPAPGSSPSESSSSESRRTRATFRYLRLAYSTKTRAVATMHLGDAASAPVELRPGRHVVHVVLWATPVDEAAEALVITGVDADVGLCVRSATFGTLAADTR